MEFQLYFCTDGILRAKLSDNKPMIPVKFLQENGYSHDNDFRFWARWWESTAHFEEGLTVGKFLACLEPWSEFWSDFTGKDVGEYIKEVRRPTPVKENEDKETPIDWVCLSYYTEVSPEIEYENNHSLDDMLEDINEWINNPKDTRLTGEWEIYSAYKLSGFVEGTDEQYSIDYTPMNELANLPIVLDNKQVLHFCNWKLPQILGDDQDHFFKPNAFGLCSFEKGFTQFIMGEKYHTIRDVIEGFFWWLHSTPAQRNDFVENILKSRINLDEFVEFDLDEEEKENNVVSLFGNKDKVDVEENIEEDKPKKMAVKVAGNAFSPIIESMNKSQLYWEDMLRLASYENNVVLKIGKTEEAKALEKRVLGHLVRGDDDPANPKPSPYKLW